MLHEAFQYPGANVGAQEIVADAVEYAKVRQYAKSLLHQTHPLEEVTENSASIRAAQCLALRGKEIEAIPAWLGGCPGLRYLALPVHLCGQLEAGLLPASLETLEFTGEGAGAIPRGVTHPGLERIVAWEARVTFNAAEFPALKHVHVVQDRKSSVLQSLAATGTQLLTLTIDPFASLAGLGSINHEALAYLRLVAGKGTTLAGIENLPTLTNLHLHNLPKLQTIEALALLPALRELSIGYCNGILDLTPITKLRALKKLAFFGCEKLPLRKQAALFQAMNLEELSLGVR